MDSFPGTSSIPIKHGRKSQTLHFFLQAPISAGRSSIPLRIVTKSCTTLSFALSLSSKHYQKGISQGHNCNVYSYALTEARKKQKKKNPNKKNKTRGYCNSRALLQEPIRCWRRDINWAFERIWINSIRMRKKSNIYKKRKLLQQLHIYVLGNNINYMRYS